MENSSACPLSGTMGANTAGMGALGTTDSCQLHSQTVFFPAGQTSLHDSISQHCSRPHLYHSYGEGNCPCSTDPKPNKYSLGYTLPCSAILLVPSLPCWRSSLPNGTQGASSALEKGWDILSPAASLEQKGKDSSRLGHAGDALCQARGPAADMDAQCSGSDLHVWMPLRLHLPQGPAGRCFLGQGHGGGKQGRVFTP